MYTAGDRIVYCNGDPNLNGEMGVIIRILQGDLDYKGREGVEVAWDNYEKVTRILSYNPDNPMGTYLWPDVFKVVMQKEPDWRL